MKIHYETDKEDINIASLVTDVVTSVFKNCYANQVREMKYNLLFVSTCFKAILCMIDLPTAIVTDNLNCVHLLKIWCFGKHIFGWDSGNTVLDRS
jgi:hypothetical protein